MIPLYAFQVPAVCGIQGVRAAVEQKTKKGKNIGCSKTPRVKKKKTIIK